MVIDEHLATRVRAQLATLPGFAERRMFGGLCFLLHGHMTAGIVGETLMLRVGPDLYEAALSQPHAREMDFTGRPLKGMIYVDAPGVASTRALTVWLGRAVAFVQSQPAKARTTKPAPRRRRNKRR